MKKNQPPHILIVDDHRGIRDALAKYLEKNRMRATSAADAAKTDRASHLILWKSRHRLFL